MNVAQNTNESPLATVRMREATLFDCIRAEQARVWAALDRGDIETARHALEVASEHVDSAAAQLRSLSEGDYFGSIHHDASECYRVARRLAGMADTRHFGEAGELLLAARAAYVSAVEYAQDIEETIADVVEVRMPHDENDADITGVRETEAHGDAAAEE